MKKTTAFHFFMLQNGTKNIKQLISSEFATLAHKLVFLLKYETHFRHFHHKTTVLHVISRV